MSIPFCAYRYHKKFKNLQHVIDIAVMCSWLFLCFIVAAKQPRFLNRNLAKSSLKISLACFS